MLELSAQPRFVFRDAYDEDPNEALHRQRRAARAGGAAVARVTGADPVLVDVRPARLRSSSPVSCCPTSPTSAPAGPPRHVQDDQGGSPEEMVAATRRMYEITVAEHPVYRIPALVADALTAGNASAALP